MIGQGAAVRCGRCRASLDLSGAPQSVNSTALAQALSSSPVPVLVDFSAQYLHPGRRADPVVDEVARAHGRKVYRTAVGEANVVEMMQAVNAAIGGEGSNGGIILPAVHLCRDSYTGMAFLLDRMAETGETISALAGHLPRFFRKLGKVAFEHGRLGTLMQTLEESFPQAQMDRLDGLKLLLPNGWIHVRASNTNCCALQ